MNGVYPITVPDRWCVHGYYSLCPYAPDGSGRLVFAGTDIKTGKTNIYIRSADGEILQKFGDGVAESNFYHTGHWQTWSPDCRFIYYQGGTMANPKICRYEIATGIEKVMDGDMEGATPFGEPILSGYLGMLYAAGYADGHYYPEATPIPFAERDRHGLFRFSVEKETTELALSINQILAIHPKREEILQREEIYRKETGNDGFTLMAYCVRWSPDGERCLFYFGNHCVAKSRKEPKLCYVFTADKNLQNIRLALDFSFGKNNGVHWSWHPDCKRLVGYGGDPDFDYKKQCLCTVNYDGSDYKKISSHSSGGHSSISPADYNLIVTDENKFPSRVVFIDLTTDTETGSYILPRVNGDNEPAGRNRFRVCFHAAFTPDGKKVLVNTLPGDNAVLCELDVIGRKQEG